jgi:AGZA family xanthine/uracil permease-like MFS transporter
MAKQTFLSSQSKWLDKYFDISKRKSTIGREVRGGVVTFLTMAYIIVLNPLILGFVKDSHGHYLGGGLAPNLPAIAAATALVAGVMTILMGAVARYPLALATGLGLNAFVAFSIASKSTWEAAMGLVVIEGVIILVLVLTGLRQAIFKAVPQQLKTAISVGIGLFIAFIAFVDAGFVHRIPDVAGTTVPVQLGASGSLNGWPIVVFVVGLLLIIALWIRKVKAAILIGIASATVLAVILEAVFHIGSSVKNPLGWGLSVPVIPSNLFDTPSFATLWHVDLFGAFTSLGVVAAILLIISLMVSDFFDTVGTMTAIGAEGDLLDRDGNPPNTKQILIVDSIAAAAGGAAGVSSNTSYIESASGVGEGARTGLASIVTGVLFLLAIFAAPLVSVIPSEAAVPALVLVGFLMMRQLGDIKWRDDDIAIPAALTIISMPFTYSISVGIGVGFISYVFIKLVRGKSKDVHPLLWGTSALFVIYFALAPLQGLLGK